MSFPLLYAATQTDFPDNGIGVLSDCLKCTVQEERNGQFELELEYPMTGVLYSEIKNDRILRVKANEKSGLQTFRIYKVSKPIGGIVTVYAQHISYQLKHITVSPTSATQCASALNALKTAACEPCPFTFWTDVATVGNFASTKPSSLRGLLGGQDGSVLDVYGGEYEFDNYAVKLWANRGLDTGVRIEYGKNLTDLKQEEYISELCTGVHPYWADSDGNCTELPEKTIQLQSGYSYPRVKTLDLSSEFEDKPSEAELREKAQVYIQTAGLASPKVGIDLSFLPLWQTDEYKNDPLYKQVAGIERLGLCDTITVRYPKLGVEEKAKITGYVYDCLLERYDRMSIGSVSSGLSETIAKIQISKKSEQSRIGQEIRAAQAHLQNLITGAVGGHIVLNFGDDGQTAELLCMDTADKATCKQCIRLNKEGIGFSKDGYNGPFNAAIGIDGGLFSQWIATWQLTANIIKAGVLQDVNGTNWLNLDTGEVHLASYATTEYANEKSTDAINSANQNTSNALANYTTIEKLNSSIETSAASIKLEVSKSYATKDSLGNYTPISEVRSKFAMDATSVTIDSGTITFNSNSIIINSSHFKLAENGNVSADGSFASYNDGSTGKMVMDGGHICTYYNNNTPNWTQTMSLWSDWYTSGLKFHQFGSHAGISYTETSADPSMVRDGVTIGSFGQKMTFVASEEWDRRMLFGVYDSRWTLCPANNGYIGLGTPEKPWGDVYCNNIYILDKNGGKKRGIWKWVENIGTVLCME